MPNKKIQKSYQANAPRQTKRTSKQRLKKNNEGITRVWQKWRVSASQTHLWLIKVWFSASTFVVKIATFAKPKTVTNKPKYEQLQTALDGFPIIQTSLFPLPKQLPYVMPPLRGW
jgi:hypothetical protein